VEELVYKYGYLIIFIVTLLEGETILIIAGFAAYQGYLDLELAILSAFSGSTLADQIFFHIARKNSRYVLRRYRKFNRYYNVIRRYIDRYGSAVVLMARYMYGIRTALIIMVGISGMNKFKFAILNIIAAAIWAVSFGYAGFFFGKVAEEVVGDVQRYQLYGWGILLIAISLLYLVSKLRLKQLKKQGESEDAKKD
jgi:membrane protein DedA with SNARE-associated domain